MGRFALISIAWVAIAQETPTFRTGTQLVLVNVVVRDKNGPVYGLKKEAFELVDKGKPQSIAVFEAPTPAGARPAPQARQPNLYTNRLSPAMTPRGGTVILLDLLNTQMADQQYARQQILKLLSSLDTRQRVAIYLLTNKLTVLQDFTDDLERLVAAARRAQSAPATTLDASQATSSISAGADEETDALLNENLRQMRDFFTARRADTTLQAVISIANRMAAISGAKQLIWVTGSFPMALNLTPDNAGGPGTAARTSGGGMSQAVPDAASAPQGQLDVLRDAVRALNNRGLAVYPVDARGLVGMPDSKTAASAGGSRRSMMRSTVGTLRPPDIDTMQDVAERTGGKAFYGTNDISGAIRQALDDAEATYVLGFYPDERALDRKFHDLKVKVAGSGIEVRSRRIYYAGPEAAASEKLVLAKLENAAQSPVDAGGIGIAAQVGPARTPESFLLRIAFELSDLRLDRAGDKWKGAADLWIVQQGSDGRTLALASQAYNFDMQDDAYRARLREGIVVDKEITPKPGLFQVKVLVADRATGVVGSIRVPAPKK